MKGHAGYAGAALGLLSLFALGQAIPLVKEGRADLAAAPRAEAPRAHSLEELYRAVQDMCNNGMASNVYDRLQAECQRHIEGRLDGLLGQTPDTLAFLNLVHGAWDDHCEQMHTLRSIFLYLDRTYVMQADSRRSNPTLAQA